MIIESESFKLSREIESERKVLIQAKFRLKQSLDFKLFWSDQAARLKYLEGYVNYFVGEYLNWKG